MANPVSGKSLCSDWFFLGQDFAVRTVSMETVQSVYFFFFGAKPTNLIFVTKAAKKKSFFTLKLPEEAKKIEIFPKFQRWMKTNMFKCKAPEVHFTNRNRVPYNKQLTTQACSGRNGEYWPEVVVVRTAIRSVRTATTSNQYSQVRLSRSVCEQLNWPCEKYWRATVDSYWARRVGSCFIAVQIA